MHFLNLLRAWAADSFIQLGYAIAPDHYLEGMFTPTDEE